MISVLLLTFLLINDVESYKNLVVSTRLCKFCNKNYFYNEITQSNRLNGLTCRSNAINGFITQVNQNWNNSISELKLNPLAYISIPLSAAFVGYITNWIGVKMLFYPIQWIGIPIIRWPNQPLGIVGWQGIVPAKRVMMASRMVDVTISKLLKISEVFNLLKPSMISQLILSSVQNSISISTNHFIPNYLIPGKLLKPLVSSISKDIIKNIENLIDIRTLVINEMTLDPTTLGSFFQFVAQKELNFLINSGFGFGFLLGIFQMLLWMIYPKNWTLPVFGGIIGYITNWIALKWIFEPLTPIIIGPLMIHGMFLRRQLEVSRDFCNYIGTKVLTSYNVWTLLLNDKNSYKELVSIISSHIPNFPKCFYENVIDCLRFDISKLSHPIHAYTDQTIKLSSLLYSRMMKLTPIEFEQVLHPIFQEDEMTLIIAGGVLGAITGGLQWWINILIENRKESVKLKSIIK